MKKHITASEEETRALGRKIAESLKIGDIIALTGDLGCGKTAFTKGVVSYFGNADDVTSPTFTLVNEYDGTIPIYHFDVYRLENSVPEQCDWIDDYLFGDGICLIEWADNIKTILPENTIRIEFSKLPDSGDDFREITVIAQD